MAQYLIKATDTDNTEYTIRVASTQAEAESEKAQLDSDNTYPNLTGRYFITEV
jgi:hypothetical protein